MRKEKSEGEKLDEFAGGPIPIYYAKVIDVGPEGETDQPDVMPVHAAMEICGIPPETYSPPHGRSIVVRHPGGTTVIWWNELNAGSKTITPEA